MDINIVETPTISELGTFFKENPFRIIDIQEIAEFLGNKDYKRNVIVQKVNKLRRTPHYAETLEPHTKNGTKSCRKDQIIGYMYAPII